MPTRSSTRGAAKMELRTVAITKGKDNENIVTRYRPLGAESWAEVSKLATTKRRSKVIVLVIFLLSRQEESTC
jgi:hypothetical protein